MQPCGSHVHFLHTDPHKEMPIESLENVQVHYVNTELEE